MDIAVAAVGLVVLSPLVAAIAVAIRRDSPGPIFYRGVRVGRRGRHYRLVKFRTMRADAERAGIWSTAGDDPRITRLGRLLRRYKLDELPNLWNVLVGEMSLVGPRPQVPSDVARYTAEERLLLSIRPGVTDWASLRFRNEAEILRGHADPDAAYDRLIRPGKIALGLQYVRERSILVDLSILAATLRAALGLSAPEAAPVEPRAER